MTQPFDDDAFWLMNLFFAGSHGLEADAWYDSDGDSCIHVHVRPAERRRFIDNDFIREVSLLPLGASPARYFEKKVSK
jgi:hypothetical protein